MGTTSLIVKCQHRDSKIRAAFRPGRIYEREVRFYKELAHEAEIGTPKLYYGEVDKESNKYILLLEDLAPARVGDNVAGCSLDEAELAMRQLAGLHASFWESSRLRELSWMPSSSDISAYHLDIHLQHLPAFREKYASRASSYLLDVAEKLGNHLVPIWNQYAQPPLTVVHGDFRLDNLFFGSEEGGKEFAAVDWQMVFRGRGACDVAFFLGSSLDPDTHGAHAESELLNTYHTALLEKGVQGYDFNQFADDYQLSIFHLLTVAVRSFAFLDFSSERQDALVSVILERLTAFLERHQVEKLLT